MRNLRNIKHRSLRFDADHPSITATAWDLDDLVCAFGPTESSPAITLKRVPGEATNVHQAETIASWDAPCPNPDQSSDRIVNLHCFDDTISLVLEGGDIVVVRPGAGTGQDLIEIVGSVDVGIAAAAWSPDQELLAIATKAKTLLLMTKDFEGTANVDLAADESNVPHQVSVGWGKKETQFKGRGVAKTLRDPTIPEHVDEGTLSQFDDGGASISWRGDGQYLALNSILDDTRRTIRVYTRDGVPESVSEPVNGLQSALSWKPSGQLVASVQDTDVGARVVFFERNGLRHGEFDLRLQDPVMQEKGRHISLAWNVNSTVLAVILADRLQLWTSSNYHWYLKQEILFIDSASSPHNDLHTTWHPEKPLQLSCASSVGSLRLLNFVSTLSRGSTRSPHDIGLLAVIDGKHLKLTPLRTANVPPPMALDEVALPSNAVDVAFSADGRLFAVLHSHNVTVWQCDYAARPLQRASLTKTIDLMVGEESGLDTDLQPRQISCLPGSDDWTVLCAADNAAGGLRSTANFFVESLPTPSEGPIATFASSSDHDSTFVQDEKGEVLIVKDDVPELITSLPAPCPVFDIWKATPDRMIAFGLSEGGVLHIVPSGGSNLRIPGCTSFLVTDSHLIYTTSQHLLKFVHLQNHGDLQIPLDEPEKDERCRNVERGAKIITVIPSAVSLVLQMPRGNLETIYPRILVLAGIRQNIVNRDYKGAFLACRTHRVDMNILHDYAPELFMQDVALFIKQVKKTEYIDLFLSSLSEENVAETLYKETLVTTAGSTQPNGQSNGVEMTGTASPAATATSKVNTICGEFLRVLRAQSSRHLQNIITTHVCKSPPDLEAGLQLVSELRRNGKQEELEQAADHICFLADVNQLYDTALGLYDLDVALLVAQQSQKDPREYMPYLQRLQEMDEQRRRFHVDDDLKRYRKALSHLHALSVFEELKEYMAKYDLYRAAMELYRYDDAKLTQLMRLYADHLNSRNRYKESGIAYEYVQDYVSAYESFRAAGMWQECLAAAALASLGKEELTALASDLASSLEEGKDLEAAATVHLEYLDDLEAAIRLLCKGYHFAKATRLAAMRQRTQLLKSLIDPGLVEASATITELLAEMKTQLNAQVPRLREVRQKKVDDPMAFLEGGGDGDDNDIPDNLSIAPTDASTTGTFMTRYTNRSTGTLATNATRKTSKNRRREERKRAKGKKGTVYEEEYLVNSIVRLIERLNSVMEDVTKLVEGLMRRAMRERAVAVESAMRELVGICQTYMVEVFEDQAGRVEQQPDLSADTASARPVGGQGVLWEALNSSGQRPVAPTLRTFEHLSLLQ